MLLIFLFSFSITIIFLSLYIKYFSKLKFFKKAENIQSNKKSCIQELHSHKSSVPTMGGIAMNLSLLLSTFLYYFIYKQFFWLNILLLLFGVMGFIDDYIKIKKVRDGVTPKEKLFGLTIISALIIFFIIKNGGVIYSFYIPFLNFSLKLNIFLYFIVMVFLVVLSSNSVNITDGVDGLALSICSVSFVTLILLSFLFNSDLVLFTSVVMLASCLGTLVFNKYPAKIFIGDTGSLFLGGVISVLLIELNLSFLIFFILIVCLFETLSVILQLSSIKYFNKRIFKIAPFHHHLEKCGWKETTITITFTTISAVFSLISILIITGGAS